MWIWEGDPRGWSPRLIIVLGSWEKTIPRSQMWITIYILKLIIWHTHNICESMWIYVNFIWICMDCAAGRQCAPVCASVICNVWQCAPQCAAVMQKCGSVRQRVAACGSAVVCVRQCSSVRQCGSVRQCARGCAAVLVAVCGGVWRCAGQCVVVGTYIYTSYTLGCPYYRGSGNKPSIDQT